MELTSESVDRLDALAACTALLSRLCLAAPDPGLLERLADEQTWDSWPLAREENVEARRLVRTGSAADVGDLTMEYQRLFVGPAPLATHPYESVHLSKDHLVFDDQTIAVRRAYAAAGLAAPRPDHEPDDHVGLEFDFVARVAARAVTAADRGAAEDAAMDALRARAFWRDHIQRWVPDWARVLGEDARLDFYRGLAALTLDTLDQVP